MKKLIAFDLDDTLSESKTELSEEMSHLLSDLLKLYKVVIISGCAYKQFEKQVILPLITHNIASPVGFLILLQNLSLLPASGSQYYSFTDLDPEARFRQIYHNNLPLREKVQVYNAFQKACKNTNIFPSENAYGEIAEDRESQITFSMCGQEAPLEIKKEWDPRQSKRLMIAKEMIKILDGKFEATVGGATSIDVSRKGENKANGLLKLLTHLNLRETDTLFVADALWPGGNDYSVTKTKIECISVNGPEDTAYIIKKLIEGKNAVV